jgi:phosphatidylserine/phosphatidylglycerophosphate/cardiolipin synthase-like enzyme
MNFKLLLPCWALLFSAAQAQSIFVPENGNYRYLLDDILQEMGQQGMHYLSLQRHQIIDGARYKKHSRRNEYQVKDWFKHDWFELQDMFSLNMNHFNRTYGARTFNEAKRRQYSDFSFDRKHFVYRKKIPAMKEWGGLTHPPIKQLTVTPEKIHAGYGPIDYSVIQSPYFDSSLQQSIDAVSGSELSFGNQLVALADHDVFLEKKKIISAARQNIFMSSLVFVCDQSTREIVNLLMLKKQEGLDVRVMTDGTLSKLMKHRSCLSLMRQAGIEVLETRDFFRHKAKAIYHTKTLVVDFKVAIAGGHNMLDADNLSRGTDFKNRDVDLKVTGPSVTDMAKQFIENWSYQLGFFKKQELSQFQLSSMQQHARTLQQLLAAERTLGLRGSEYYQRVLSSAATRMRGVCRFIKQAPYDDRHSIGKAYLKLLDQVQHYLLIEDPAVLDTYTRPFTKRPLIDTFDNFEMFNRLHRKVQQLAQKGLSIDYVTTNIDMAGNENVAMLNEKIANQLESGKPMQANWSFIQLHASNRLFGKPHYENLLRDWVPYENVHVWTNISFMHSKIFYFDRIVASVGSYNFQHNATDHAYESTTICMDESLNRQLDRILVQDMANSLPLMIQKKR